MLKEISEIKMISIITCSRNIEAALLLKENIEATIGTDFEFLPFDNTKYSWGICKVYNYQLLLAKGDLVCFIHDDVKFLTQNWGLKLIQVFRETPNLGLVGLAGSGYKTKMSSTWSAAPKELQVAVLFEHKKYRRENSGKIELKGNGSAVQEVVNLDGYFLATKREIALENKFDELLLTGFHAYDIDYSMQIGSKYKLVVLSDIESEHFSDGNPDLEWFKDAEKITKKWINTLPRSIKPLNYIERERQEYKAYFKALIVLYKSKPFNIQYFINFILSNFHFSFISIFIFKTKIDNQLKRLLL